MATKCGAPTLVAFTPPTGKTWAAYDATYSKLDSVLGVDGTNEVHWEGATPGTANAITGYDLEYHFYNTHLSIWQVYQRSYATTATQHTANLNYTFDENGYDPVPRGANMRVRVRTKGAAGATYYSDWSAYVYYRRNVQPSPPVYSIPSADGKTTYNPRPRMLMTFGTDADGSVIESGGHQWGHDTTATVSGNGLAAGAQVRVRKTAEASPGNVRFETLSADAAAGGYGAYCNLAGQYRDVTYAAATYAETLAAGTTRIKAAHMTELRTMIDTVRDYYGLSAYSWAETIEAGTSMAGWRDHIAEMRTAIDEIIALVNGWDTTSTVNQIAAPTWIAIVGAQPSAAVMQQIRDIIPTL